jgi:two-component system invasion response regulator UvrY
MIRVLLADDHNVVRAGLAGLLSEVAWIKLVAEVESGEQAIEAAMKLEPHVVLIDINMPGIGGIEATKKILQKDPRIKVIILTVHNEQPFPTTLLQAGAAGYITKDANIEEILRAIKTVHTGGQYLSRSVAHNLALSTVNKRLKDDLMDTLSGRELQTLLMIANGKSVTEISELLCLSPKTINTYRYRLFDKLGVNSNVSLAHFAMRNGLIDAMEQANITAEATYTD